jgi:hypothetical protein
MVAPVQLHCATPRCSGSGEVVREGVCVGVGVGETDSAAVGVRPAVTDWELEPVEETDSDLEEVPEDVCVGDADGGGTVGHALLAPLRRSDGRLLRVQEVGLLQDPAVPAGKVITAEMPPADTELCQPAAPSRQTSPSAFAVPVDVMLSGPTAITREPAHGLPSKVTAEIMHVSLGLRSARRGRKKRVTCARQFQGASSNASLRSTTPQPLRQYQRRFGVGGH